MDLVKHVVFCFAFGWEDSVVCSLLGFILTLFFHVYLCLNICIALSLHLVVILSRRPSRKWEKYYWAASIGLPLLLNVPLLRKLLYEALTSSRRGVWPQLLQDLPHPQLHRS